MQIKQNIILYFTFLTILACSNSIEPIDEPLGPTATTLLFPENDKECNTGIAVDNERSTVNFQWNTSENTDSYEVILKELDSEAEIKVESNINEADITIKKATAYRWKVISKSTTSDKIAESEVWRFYNSGDGVINYAPFPADVVQPTIGNNLDANTTSVSLEWSGSDVDNDIIGYEVYFGTDNPPMNSLDQITNSSTDVAVVTGNTYYWMIKTTDEANNTSESEVFWFKVD
ncbi:hypothetical protein [Spongiimicrobium sp. 3-5]|uniref:hypothetical protein n=1 Tax=Spongiimicrobium sp. 3-5 TaxID=3332596 RepID=UPI003980F406